MPNDSSSTYIFSPRPDAYDMDWESLLPPVRKAVRDLLLRLDGATRMVEENMRDKEKNKPQMTTANCFLVHGDRGTGKTTVLLSAKRACNKNLNDAFFDTKDQGDFYQDAQNSARRLQDIIWLDVLDLEPLPPKTNLLTTVLTRVRNALYPSDTEDSSIEATSILEERADSARHKLDQLIKDAALMWEDIDEPDTRSRANRQVAAADIYSKFQKNFRKAMDSLTQELAHRSATGKSHVQIVLPIDNIDRSTEHLYSIVKLAQMVSCHRFWLVLAGDRQDVETFLERAYWKELIRIGKEGAGATGKTGIGGEDEALVMARRQAAAASHKLLPPSHRVEVGLVSADETLNFKPSSMSGNDKNISELLGAVRIVTEAQVNKDKVEEEERNARESETANTTDKKTGNNSGNDQPHLELLDLFDARRLMQDIVELDHIAERKDEAQSQAAEGAVNAISNNKTVTQTDNNSDSKDTKKKDSPESETFTTKEKKSYLTDAAQLGLRLPARSVIDLWQLAYWVTTDPTIKEHRRAETIARTMLRNVITESSIPSDVGRRLQEQIIRHTHQGGTILDFEDPKIPDGLLHVSRVQSLDFMLPKVLHEIEDHSIVVQSWLEVMQVKILNLKLKHIQPVYFRIMQQNEDHGNNSNPETDYILLPDLVAAWLTVLHDTLIWGPDDSDVIGVDPSLLRPYGIVMSAHNAVTTKPDNEQNNYMANSKHSWQPPSWQTFIVHDVFWQYWRQFLDNFEHSGLPNVPSSEAPKRLLVIGWIVCVLKTFLTYGKLWKWEVPKVNVPKLEDYISLSKYPLADNTTDLEDQNSEEKNRVEGNIQKAEIDIMLAAARVYQEVQSTTRGEVYRADEVRRTMRDWLELELPYLLSYLFVPIPSTENKTRADEIINHKAFSKTCLAEKWRNNLPFICRILEWHFRQLSDSPYLIHPPFPPFNDLAELWDDLKPEPEPNTQQPGTGS